MAQARTGCRLSWHFEKYSLSVREPAENRVSKDGRPSRISGINARKSEASSNTSRSASTYLARYNPVDAQLRQVRGAFVGLYRRDDSRFWWMSYTWKGEQHFESTKTTSKALARRILDRREGEIAMDLFKLGRQGGRMSFTGLGGKTKTEGSSEPVPLTGLARDVFFIVGNRSREVLARSFFRVR